MKSISTRVDNETHDRLEERKTQQGSPLGVGSAHPIAPALGAVAEIGLRPSVDL